MELSAAVPEKSERMLNGPRLDSGGAHPYYRICKIRRKEPSSAFMDESDSGDGNRPNWICAELRHGLLPL